MGFILRVFSIFGVALRRLIAQRGLAVATALGLITSIGLVMSVPLYTDAVYYSILQDELSHAEDQNVALKDGDTIFVPRAESVYVFGQVKNPGAYALQQRDTTVLQALSLAGGVTERGATGRIKIVRIKKGKTVEVKVKLTDTVRPGDTITYRRITLASRPSKSMPGVGLMQGRVEATNQNGEVVMTNEGWGLFGRRPAI